jgi:hypothetical protein
VLGKLQPTVSGKHEKCYWLLGQALTQFYPTPIGESELAQVSTSLNFEFFEFEVKCVLQSSIEWRNSARQARTNQGSTTTCYWIRKEAYPTQVVNAS